jgi:HSP20 family molecular chaperone IbpA
MAFFPSLLGVLDEMYNNVESQQEGFANPIPLLLMPQRAYVEKGSQGSRSRRSQRRVPPGSEYKVSFNVKNFKPEEINVKVKGREINIEAKHEEQLDEFGYVSRQFMRRFELPQDFDIDTVSTSLTAGGELIVKALKPQPAIETTERVIPIQHIPLTQAVTSPMPTEKPGEAQQPEERITPQG